MRALPRRDPPRAGFRLLAGLGDCPSRGGTCRHVQAAWVSAPAEWGQLREQNLIAYPTPRATRAAVRSSDAPSSAIDPSAVPAPPRSPSQACGEQLASPGLVRRDGAPWGTKRRPLSLPHTGNAERTRRCGKIPVVREMSAPLSAPANFGIAALGSRRCTLCGPRTTPCPCRSGPP
jgi:hypothetical protein